jgi:Fusaric acid resistance protein family
MCSRRHDTAQLSGPGGPARRDHRRSHRERPAWATGGPNGEAFMLALTRCSEICIGIVCAGIVLAGTDFGGASRRLATLIASISTEITGGFAGTLALAGPELPDTQPARRELIRRVIELEPVIDETIGESSQLRYHSPVLRMAVDGLLAAVAGWPHSGGTPRPAAA